MENPKEATNLIERIDAFEIKLDVKLEALSAWIENGNHREFQVRVSGEMHSRNDTTLKQTTRIIVDVYDSNGRILGTNNWIADWLDESIEPNKFFGFHTFTAEAGIPIAVVSKIRVYPKKCRD